MTGALGRILGINGATGVEIAVRFLGARDFCDQVVEIGVQVRVTAQCEGIGRTFHYFHHIGVIEENALEGPIFHPCSHGEVVYPVRLFAFLETVGDGYIQAGRLPWRPEGIIDGYPRERHGLNGIVTRGQGHGRGPNQDQQYDYSLQTHIHGDPPPFEGKVVGAALRDLKTLRGCASDRER